MGGRDVNHVGLWAMQRQRIINVRERKCKDLCGVHWLVRSDEIKIQAQYGGRWTWTYTIAVSGSFLQGHTLVINRDGTVTWDGARVVSSFPARFQNDLVRLRYSKNRDFEKASRTRTQWRGKWTGFNMRTLRINLPDRVLLTVNVASAGSLRFLDAFITLAPPVGCDGHCGKGDGNLIDDTTNHFMRRISQWQVAQRDLLIDRKLLLSSEASQVVARDDENETECFNGTFDDAVLMCRSAMPHESSTDWLSACAEDVCGGGSVMADHTRVFSAQAEEALVEEYNMATGACHTCIPGDLCFDDVAWAMEVGVPSRYYTDERWSPEVDEQSCFEEVQRALRAWQRDETLRHWVGGLADPNVPAPCHDSANATYRKDGLTYCR